MVTVRRFGPDSVGAFDSLHRSCEDGGWCSCVAWWVPTWDGFGDRTAEQNAEVRQALSQDGEFDGYLAFDGDEPVGWCQVGPRDRLHKLREQFGLDPSIGTWAITCFKVHPDRRRDGVATQLLQEVLSDLPSHGALRVEAFPKRLDRGGATDLWTGPEALYLREGFVVVQDHPRKPVLAKDLAGG